ncbi:MAG: pseudouridine synthase [Thermodesulfobacteriota bacterium]
MGSNHDRGSERLNKIIAASGIASRRRADEVISSGRVAVNGKVVTQAGSKAVWGADVVTVDGRRLPPPPKKVYLLLNKPFGYMCTMHDPQGRPTVKDLLAGVEERVYPVGRLDFDTLGLLILTNDGELAFRLMHPSFQIPRTYKALIEGIINPRSVQQLRKGVMLEDGPANPARVRILKREQGKSLLRITVTEGRSREIRRLMEAVGYQTIHLMRIGYGSLRLGTTKVGAYRRLTAKEVQSLRSSVALD